MGERIRSSGAQFFVCFVEVAGAMSVTLCTCKCALCDTFSEIVEQNRVPEMSFSCLQNVQIYYSSAKYKLSISPFLNYCCTVVFVHNILCPSTGQKEVWCMIQMFTNFFQP